MAQEKSIEVKVGALVLVSLGILAGFVLIMGGLSFEKTYTLYIDFDDPGGLQMGAPVLLSGVKVGKVTEIKFMGGKMDPQLHRRVLVRAKAAVEQRVKDAIHDDADFYVTTQGILGEKFLAIDPGSLEKPVLADNSIVKGIDPPRLDLFFARTYELLDTMMTAIRNNRELINDMVTNTAGILKGLNTMLNENRDRINRTISNLELLSQEAVTLTAHVREQYVDNPKIQRTIDNVDRLSTDLQKDSAPMLKDAREALANLNRASKIVGGEEEQKQLKKMFENVAELAAHANATAADAQAIVSHIKKGNGTIGAFVMDESIYDDMQEMLRDLKHNPWKLFWRE
ncbi:MAG: MlaD family protein [Polyangiaceae bacterium]|nr:MlaD family protein [Polyangiaceae bacterium]